MRTGSTPAKSRTILCMRAVPGMARGVRRRLLPQPSRLGRRRIVLTGPSLPSPLLLSGLQSCRRLVRRHQNRDRRPLWIIGLPCQTRGRSLRQADYPQLPRARIQPRTWLLHRHHSHVTTSSNMRTFKQSSTGTRSGTATCRFTITIESSESLESFGRFRLNHFPQAPGAHSVRLATRIRARRGRAVRAATQPGPPPSIPLPPEGRRGNPIAGARFSSCRREGGGGHGRRNLLSLSAPLGGGGPG